MQNLEEKLKRLEDEQKKLEEKMKHMSAEYAQTRAGSAYGVEYYEIQVKVYQAMIADIRTEIVSLKKQLKGIT